jgi:hypothetical protein
MSKRRLVLGLMLLGSAVSWADELTRIGEFQSAEAESLRRVVAPHVQAQAVRTLVLDGVRLDDATPAEASQILESYLENTYPNLANDSGFRLREVQSTEGEEALCRALVGLPEACGPQGKGAVFEATRSALIQSHMIVLTGRGEGRRTLAQVAAWVDLRTREAFILMRVQGHPERTRYWP